MNSVTLYTDAGCKDTLGSYAYFVDESLKGSDSLEGFVTPTSCELLAVIIGLKRLFRNGYEVVEVKTDSQYVAGVMNNQAHWVALANSKKSHRSMVRRLYKTMVMFRKVIAVWIPEGSEYGNVVAHRIASARLRENIAMSEPLEKEGVNVN